MTYFRDNLNGQVFALGSKYPHKKLGMVVNAIIPVLGKQDKVDHQAS